MSVTRPRIRSSNEAVPGAESGSSIYSGATAEIDASLRDLTSVIREGCSRVQRLSQSQRQLDSLLNEGMTLLSKEKEDDYATRLQEAIGILTLRE